MGFLSRLFGRDDTAAQKDMQRRAQARKRAAADAPPAPRQGPAPFGKADIRRKQPKTKP